MPKTESSQAPLVPVAQESALCANSVTYQVLGHNKESRGNIESYTVLITANIAAGNCISSYLVDPEIALRLQEARGKSDLAPLESVSSDRVEELMGRPTDESSRISPIECTKVLTSACLGIVALSTTTILMARGGNFKNTRLNLQNQGKTNAKQKMSPEQKKLRRRKRKKKH